MQFAEAYRNLVRPSSALEPSHPLNGLLPEHILLHSVRPNVAQCVVGVDFSSRQAQHLVALVLTPRLYQTRLLRES